MTYCLLRNLALIVDFDYSNSQHQDSNSDYPISISRSTSAA